MGIMTLRTVWMAAGTELESKHVQQIVGIAGQGKLRDGNDCSLEFRIFLKEVPSEFLQRYAAECLATKFEDNGLVLQDVVNEIGRRLGFEVTNGRYRGMSQQIGNDGLWRSQTRAIVVESKTTDAYQIDLDVLARYKKSLIGQGHIDDEHSSLLLVVGRQVTDGLEAQIRGSRHAWDTRLISVDALCRLMLLKQGVDNPEVLRKVQDVLVPREFTKLDDIIDFVFSASEDVRSGESDAAMEGDETPLDKERPADFNESCVTRIQYRLKRSLIRQSRVIFASSDSSVVVLCVVSKEHLRSGVAAYWYAFHPHQREQLEKAKEAWVALGCGSSDQVLLVPFVEFVPWLESLWTTNRDGKMYWHVRISKEADGLFLNRIAGHEKLNLSRFLI